MRKKLTKRRKIEERRREAERKKRSEAARRGWVTRRQREEERRREAERKRRSEAARRGWVTRRQREEERRREAERKKRSEAARRAWITRRQREEERRRKKKIVRWDRREFQSLYDAAREHKIPQRKVDDFIGQAIAALRTKDHLTASQKKRFKQKWDELFETINAGYWFVLWRGAYDQRLRI